jgi:uncharacterized membrane protein
MRINQNHFSAITWMTSISALILFFLSSLRHWLFQSLALDLAVFDQWVYLVSQGLPPISSFFGFHLIGDHAAFIFYPIALLYKIYPDVHWLFAVQAVGLAIGAIPVYALSLQSGLPIAHARAMALSYLLYPCLFNSNFFTDFRPESIAIPALLWAIWAGIGKKTWQFIAAVTLALSCKDSLSLTIIAFGIWLWLIKRPRYGIACILTGAIWYKVTIGYFVPMLRGGQAGGVVFFASLGNSPAEIIWNIITQPTLILGKFIHPEALFYYLLLILPVIIGLHWRQAAAIVPALPMLLLNILSDYSAQRDLVHHYSLTIFPFIIVWLIYSIREYRIQRKRPWLKPRLLITWAIIAFLALAKYEFFITRYLSSLPNLNSLHTAVALVKTQGSLATTYKIAPHLSHRQNINIVSTESEASQAIGKFEYILIDLKHSDKGHTPEFLSTWVKQLKNQTDYKLEYEKDDVFLWHRHIIVK